MYSNKPSFIYGFHGIDKSAAIKILNQKSDFKQSDNNYDWLGQGIYFWENNLERAVQYAVEENKRRNTKVKEPFALGAVIDLGNCLDLLDQKYLDFIRITHTVLENTLRLEKKPLPENGKFGINDFDFRKRELDCAVIRTAHEIARKNGEHFDTVRAAFLEGERLYPGAGFRMQNHIQIAVLNPNCIKGIFLPREKVNFS